MVRGVTGLPPLRFTWERTWPDDRPHKDDWTAHPYDGDPMSCRIIKDRVVHENVWKWRWVANGDRYIAQGWADSAKLAARAAEDAFFAAVADGRTRPIGTPSAEERSRTPGPDIDY